MRLLTGMFFMTLFSASVADTAECIYFSYGDIILKVADNPK